MEKEIKIRIGGRNANFNASVVWLSNSPETSAPPVPSSLHF